MAFMRMMGRESVAYHQATVLGRADDHPGQVLDYYGTRGETPLVWGGSGAGRLGLAGTVTPLTYGAVFGAGGAVDPVTGARLVNTRRPGMELVVSPHKSVAVLGATGRADDMHAIVDAETTATLEFVDAWFRERGGRRGRDQVRTTTSGLTWAVTRHGTSRAGDPAVHDHVLVANVVEMGDVKGGWKALDTASLRDVLHAATIVGRAAGARRAVELGYGVEADDGRSGRLRSWRIAGVPGVVCDLFSKRSAEIDDFVDDRGTTSYQARAMAARTTRASKVEQSPDRLAGRWHAELAGIGWTPARLVDAIDHPIPIPEVRAEVPGPGGQGPEVRTGPVRGTHQRLVVADGAWFSGLVKALIGPESRLGGVKVWSRRDLVVEVGPHLYGQPVDRIDEVVDRILASEMVVPLVAVTAAREQVYAPTRALAVEQAIADTVERLAIQPARPVPTAVIDDAITAAERALGRDLTVGQTEAVTEISAGRARVQFIVGVAGAGKTTALDAATTALQADGWHVVGASTSGQATRTLGSEAGIEARTVASLLWRLDHHHEQLGPRSVVVLDEAAMTTDQDLLRLVTALEVTGGRLVVVGDPVQLGAVGPGGAMAALMHRHPDLVTTMGDSVRQHDPDERTALTALRNGRTHEALAWYSTHDRIRTTPTLADTFDQMTAAWNRDLAAGRSTTMLAWRRDHVAELNRRARNAAIDAGRVHGPGLDVGDGFEVAAGDHLVALTPNHPAGIVTSQHLRVTAVDPDQRTVTVTTDGDEHTIELSAADVAGGRVGYGYATTIHRSQGATFDTCHVYADGGTHHLTYVALSRARHSTHIHCVADNHPQALEDLAVAWARPDAQRWIIDDRPDPSHADRTPRRITDDLRRSRLHAEHDTLRHLQTTLGDTTQVDRLIEAHRWLEQEQRDLRSGTGVWANTPAGTAARRLTASHAHQQVVRRAETPGLSWRARRAIRQEIDQLDDAVTHASTAWQRHGQPLDDQLTHELEIARDQLAHEPSVLDLHETRDLLDRRLHVLEAELGIVPEAPNIRHRLDPPGPDLSIGLGM